MSSQTVLTDSSNAIRTFCVSGGLSLETASLLESKEFTSLDHLKAVEDSDLDQLGLSLGEKVLLRAKISELQGASRGKGSRWKSYRHEFTNATYKNDDKITSWTKGTFILSATSLSFFTEENKPMFYSSIEDIYHIKKSDSSVNFWPFRTNAINIFADNIKHKVHLGSLRDSVYEKLSIFFESRQYKVD